ncbi:hypothetical protein [Aquipseudomonas campi]
MAIPYSMKNGVVIQPLLPLNTESRLMGSRTGALAPSSIGIFWFRLVSAFR